MRKEKGFEVLDHINLYLAGNPMLEKLVEKNQESIMKDTLTEKIFYNQERNTYTDTKINGEDFKIDVEVIK